MKKHRLEIIAVAGLVVWILITVYFYQTSEPGPTLRAKPIADVVPAGSGVDSATGSAEVGAVAKETPSEPNPPPRPAPPRPVVPSIPASPPRRAPTPAIPVPKVSPAPFVPEPGADPEDPSSRGSSGKSSAADLDGDDFGDATPSRDEALLAEVGAAPGSRGGSTETEAAEPSFSFFKFGKLQLNLFSLYEKNPDFRRLNPRFTAENAVRPGGVDAGSVLIPAGTGLSALIVPGCDHQRDVFIQKFASTRDRQAIANNQSIRMTFAHARDMTIKDLALWAGRQKCYLDIFNTVARP